MRTNVDIQTNEKIDIVIPWVDGSDPNWIREKKEWFNKINPDYDSNSELRYQSWDNMKYWFRAIEKCLPWVNRVFFVTWGHVPDFLCTENEKIRIVKHTDYIPKVYLPTFNVNTIELNLHRIEELSEHFIYFNDDTFPLEYINSSYYFQDGVPCDEAIETPIIPFLSGEISKYTWNMRALDVAVINRNFKKRVVQEQCREKWFNECYGELLERNRSLSYWDNFVGFRDPHVPTAFCKSTFQKVWDAEYEVLHRACMSKFRDFSCVNQWLIRYWRLCEGDFSPRMTRGKSYTVSAMNCEEVASVIRKRAQQMICINEECSGNEFMFVKSVINHAFDELFSKKSVFEK